MSGKDLANCEEERGRLLGGLRERITATDQEIIRLLGTRHRLILEVGEVKLKNGLRIQDEGREEALLCQLTSAGEKEGLSSEFVRSLYRLIIEQSVAAQEELK